MISRFRRSPTPIRRVSTVSHAVRRTKAREWSGLITRWLLVVGGLAFLATALFWVRTGPVFRVKEVVVVGSVLSDPDQIRSLVPKGASLFDRSIFNKQPSLAGLQFVQGIQIERQYPSTVVITITEPEVAFDMVIGAQHALVASNGTVVAVLGAEDMAQRRAANPVIARWLPVLEPVAREVRVGDTVVSSVFTNFLSEYRRVTQQGGVVLASAELTDVLHLPVITLLGGQRVQVNAFRNPVVAAQNTVRLVGRSDIPAGATINLTAQRWAYTHE